VGRASDRQILALALPALPALAAEPLYVLVDTAVVGHLGAAELGGLAIAALLLTDASWLCNFLIYGTTAMSARLYGAGRREEAVRLGVQSTWLAGAIGLIVVGVLQLIARPAAELIGDDPAQVAAAVSWLRIASCGAPFILISFAGQGWMRGVQDVRRPLVFLLGANALSAVLCPLLVYPLGLGLEGSAIANVFSQAVGASLFLRALHREGVGWDRDWPVMRAQLATARDLGVRTAAFSATYLAAAAVASRMGTAHVAAHQIALQLWTFLALVMDSVAIAAQSLIGERLGAGDRDGARSTARRLAEIGTVLGVVFAVLLAAGWNIVPALFTDEQAVRDQAHVAWPWFIATLPLSGLLFALDGILIGAGDIAFMRNVTLAGALGGFLPFTLAAYEFGWGLGGIWAGLLSFIVIRTWGCVHRARGGRWAVVGAPPQSTSRPT
jgi:putative MATE family efflux protein